MHALLTCFELDALCFTVLAGMSLRQTLMLCVAHTLAAIIVFMRLTSLLVFLKDY